MVSSPRNTVMLVTLLVAILAVSSAAFSTNGGFSQTTTTSTSATQLYGLFDKWTAFGSADESALDEQWEAQQEILRARRQPQSERDEYFAKVQQRRVKATEKQQDNWAWQTKTYKKGEDPLDEWKKRRADGTISNLDNQYGDEKKKGGIPIPMASFGVGGEFGVGGKFDNGGRFDLRLPYADQGYVDEDADVMNKLSNMFGGGKKKKAAVAEEEAATPTKKQGMSWPWEKK